MTICLRDVTARLEQERHRNPSACLKLCQEMAISASPEVAPLILGEWATALRALGDLDGATGVLRTAFRVARIHGAATTILGDLTQRQAGLRAYSGNFQAALSTVDRAIVLHTSAAYDNGIGRAFGDRGFYLQHLSRYTEALEAFAAARLYLPKSDLIASFGSALNASYCYRHLGDSPEARYWLSVAESYKNAPPGLHVLCQWALAEMDLDEGQDASDRLAEVRSFYLDTNQTPQAALATVQLVRSHLSQGRFEEACSVSSTMGVFLLPFSKDKISTAAVLEVMRASLAAKASLGHLAAKAERALRLAADRPAIRAT